MVDRAVCENGSFFNATTVISVVRLEPSIAKYMNLHLSRDGLTLTQEGVDLSVVYNSEADLQSVSEQSNLVQRRTGNRRGITRGKYEVEEDSRTTSSGGSVSGDSEQLDSSIYLKPIRTKNICTKIVEFFFSY